MTATITKHVCFIFPTYAYFLVIVVPNHEIMIRQETCFMWRNGDEPARRCIEHIECCIYKQRVLVYKILVWNDQVTITAWNFTYLQVKSCASRQWWQPVDACFSCIRAWCAVVKAPIHKFHAYHVTRCHQCVCRCPWYVWKSQLEDFFFVGFVSWIFVVAITDISPVTQNFHCTFNAF